MDLTLIVNNDVKMSSREIASLCEKRHPDVRRDTRKMLVSLELGVSSFAHTYKDAQNKQQEEYLLIMDYSHILY